MQARKHGKSEEQGQQGGLILLRRQAASAEQAKSPGFVPYHRKSNFQASLEVLYLECKPWYDKLFEYELLYSLLVFIIPVDLHLELRAPLPLVPDQRRLPML